MAVSIDRVKSQLDELCTRWGQQVDYLAIRLEQSEGTDIFLRGGQTETLSEGIAIGGHVRACHQGGWGFASFNDLETLATRVEEAIAAAKLIGNEETLLAPVQPVQVTQSLPLTGTDPRQVPLGRKKQLCHHYADLLQQVDQRVTTTSVRYSDTIQRVVLATSVRKGL